MTTTALDLAFLTTPILDITPLDTLPDGNLCEPCGEEPAVLRVYGDGFYVECCTGCGPWAVSLAVREQPDLAGSVGVEVAASVWACRDDEGCC